MNNDTTTKNIMHLADSAKMKMIVINKHNEKLRIWCFKMPNAPIFIMLAIPKKTESKRINLK